MKRIGITLGCVLMIFQLMSQDINLGRQEDKKTLLSNRALTGGFVALTGKGGQLNKQEDLWMGGEVAAIFGNDFGIGVAGYGLVNTVRSKNLNFNGKELYYQAGYGGLFIEPAFFEDRVLNLSFPTVLGGGGIAESRIPGVIDLPEDFDLDEDDLYNTDLFWVVEPSVAISLNISNWMKLTAGASYRYVYQLDLPNTSDDIMNGINGNVSLKLGWF